MGKFAGFNSVELTKPQRSAFDLSAFKRSSTRMGRLTPVFVSEAVPSDTFHGASEILVRVAPMLAPIFDQITLFVHFFFVPNRLLWEEWEDFITGGRLGAEAETAPIPPFFDLGDILAAGTNYTQTSTLADYLGVPDFKALPDYGAGGGAAAYNGIAMDAMPFLAYQKIYMDYYRDRNYVADDLIEFPFPSGEINIGTSVESLKLRTRSYEHEYFTSALPFTQRGAEVTMPVTLSGDFPVYGNPPGSGQSSMVMSGITQPGSIAVGLGVPIDQNLSSTSDLQARIDDLATSSTINDFRSAYALQVWLERNALGGSRYNESTLAHFGVRPQDSRLQRAEYIGGGRIPVRISEIVSTAWSTDGESTVPLANLAGHGITYGNTNQFNYFCAEHGFIVGIASLMNVPAYHQGLPRMFRRRSFLDYPWPTFAKLGEQQVDKAELYASAVNLTEDAEGQLPLFGYQSRYADWKWMKSTNHGSFHDTLGHWGITREFASSPVLGQTFLEFEDSSQDAIFAVGGASDNFWMFINNRIHAKRPLPYMGRPNTMGFS